MVGGTCGIEELFGGTKDVPGVARGPSEVVRWEGGAEPDAVGGISEFVGTVGGVVEGTVGGSVGDVVSEVVGGVTTGVSST